MIVFAIRDKKADVYGRPFFAVSSAVGIRSFSDEVNNDREDNQMHRHASDFSLYELGSYDDDTGLFVTHEPKLLINGDQCNT